MVNRYYQSAILEVALVESELGYPPGATSRISLQRKIFPFPPPHPKRSGHRSGLKPYESGTLLPKMVDRVISRSVLRSSD